MNSVTTILAIAVPSVVAELAWCHLPSSIRTAGQEIDRLEPAEIGPLGWTCGTLAYLAGVA